MRQKMYLLFCASLIMMICNFVASCSSDNDDWYENEFATLAGQKMTRGGENNLVTPIVFDIPTPTNGISFKNRSVTCRDVISDNLTCTVAISGFVVEDTILHKYRWAIQRIDPSIQYVGNINVDLCGITDAAFHACVTFVGLGGVQYRGQNDFYFSQSHDL